MKYDTPPKADRANQGKLPMSHVLDYPYALAALAEVAAYGANKYERGNYLKGQDATVTMDCLMRHLVKWWAGENLDKESGISHLSHVMWNLATLIQDTHHNYPSTYQDFKNNDDRPLVSAMCDTGIEEIFQTKGCD